MNQNNTNSLTKLINILNLTSAESNDTDYPNYYDQEKVFEHFIKKAFIMAYNRSFDKDKMYKLTIVLTFLSILGSASNFLVLIVMACRDDCMELDNFKTKVNVNERRKSIFVANNTKKSKPIYLLIQYLALVDFLTCSLAMPATIVEIWNLTESNEALCKLFEQLRATGFVLSNFIVIIISFERYFLMCKPFVFTKFKKTYLKKALFVITLLSFFIGILSMLQLSVYQKIEGTIVFIGVCLPSEMSMTYDLKLKFIITSFFLLGACIVGFIYILIFKAAFLLNKKKQVRSRIAKRANILNSQKRTSDLITVDKKKGSFQRNIEIDVCSSSVFEKKRLGFHKQNQFKLQSIHSQSLTNLKVPTRIERRISSIAQEELCISSSDSNREISKNVPINQKFSFLRTNLRMAFIIFLVTLVYYISIIPWCLTINDIITFNPFIYYTFVINSSVNPIIYGFFNPNFRNNCIDLLKISFFNIIRKMSMTWERLKTYFHAKS